MGFRVHVLKHIVPFGRNTSNCRTRDSFASSASSENKAGVACFAIYRLLCHLNLWKRIDKQGVRSEHLNNRFFTICLNSITIDTSQFTPRH
ncbi:unnamed protein product [Bemisia tabaci]|uniref:Uncharacterized protein n=1 Tax=Bemisia tabaci TaxID=7038 RepID=A0A9P0AFY5_BEMTA|nr:unnamed protein product [Bemisia tabaci]